MGRESRTEELRAPVHVVGAESDGQRNEASAQHGHEGCTWTSWNKGVFLESREIMSDFRICPMLRVRKDFKEK